MGTTVISVALVLARTTGNALDKTKELIAIGIRLPLMTNTN